MILLRKCAAVLVIPNSICQESMGLQLTWYFGFLGDNAEVLGYGHLGDGNLHLNILSSKYDDNTLAQIEPFVYEWTSAQRGSISAEHGLGLMKAEKIHYSKSPEAVQLMASIKKLMDPNSILNPYKVLPQSVL
jgi:D-2-hydroxyglutarate dehydrogenase